MTYWDKSIGHKEMQYLVGFKDLFDGERDFRTNSISRNHGDLALVRRVHERAAAVCNLMEEIIVSYL